MQEEEGSCCGKRIRWWSEAMNGRKEAIMRGSGNYCMKGRRKTVVTGDNG